MLKNDMEEQKRRLTFRKRERLCGRKSIEYLFQHGQTLHLFPVRLVYIRKKSDGKQSPKVLISVPRKHFRKAVDRNYIKRLLREAYRKNKHVLIDYAVLHDESIELALVYTSDRLPLSGILENNLKEQFQRLIFIFEESTRSEGTLEKPVKSQ